MVKPFAFEGSVKTPRIDYRDVPMAFWPRAKFIAEQRISIPTEVISAVCRSMTDCNELVKWFGNEPNFCPHLAVLLLIPEPAGINPVLITGLGYSTAAELRDCAIETWGMHTSSDNAKRFNTDELREQYGYARKEDVAALTQEAFRERVARHRASPITDPVRQFQYPNPTNKTLFVQPNNESWSSE